MNYQRHYDALIERAKGRSISDHTESHHIIPRCMGGGDGKSNRARLTPEEHYVAHQLLTRMYPEIHGLAIAAACMARDNRNGKRSSNKLYAWLRRRAALANTTNQTGKACSEETKRRISESILKSEAHIEYTESLRGIERTPEDRAKISASHKTSERARDARVELHRAKIGIPRSSETKARIGAAFIGKPLSEDHRGKIAAAHKGKLKAGGHLIKISAALLGNQNANGAVRSAETRARISAAKAGRKMSDESRRKMSQSRTPEQRKIAAAKAWETRRANAAQLPA